MLLEHGLRRSARLWPNHAAAIDGDTYLTYAEFNDRVTRLANALIDLGLEPGDRVGLLMLNSFRYLELYYAVNVAGGIIVPLNYRLAVPELTFMLNDCAARMLFVSREQVGNACRIRSQCLSIGELILADDGDSPAGFITYEDLVARGSDVDPVIPKAENDIAGIFYTGGTTGLPKGVVLTHRNVIANAYHILVESQVTQQVVYLHAAPMFHLADGGNTFAITMIGATHAHLRSFEPTAVLETIERDQVTHTVLVPTMINALVNHPAVDHYQLSSLTRISYGGSPITETTLTRAMEVFDCEFIQGYGMTEASPLVTVLSGADHRLEDSQVVRARLRSAGRSCIGVDLRLVDHNDNEVPTGTIGELVLRGDNVMLGYWERPDETAQALRNGWLHTGDMGVEDVDHYVYIVDRKKDMIVSGGENIYSIEVENAVASHPSVLEAAVIGVPDEHWGEAVTAVIVPRAGHRLIEDEIIDHCRERIARYKVPKRVVFRESLPKSGAGKILKRAIRDEFWTGETRFVH